MEIPSDLRDQLLGSGTAAGSAVSALGLSGPWYKKAMFYEREFKAGPVPIARCIGFIGLLLLMIILFTRLQSGLCFPGQVVITWTNYGACGTCRGVQCRAMPMRGVSAACAIAPSVASTRTR